MSSEQKISIIKALGSVDIRNLLIKCHQQQKSGQVFFKQAALAEDNKKINHPFALAKIRLKPGGKSTRICLAKAVFKPHKPLASASGN